MDVSQPIGEVIGLDNKEWDNAEGAEGFAVGRGEPLDLRSEGLPAADQSVVHSALGDAQHARDLALPAILEIVQDEDEARIIVERRKQTIQKAAGLQGSGAQLGIVTVSPTVILGEPLPLMFRKFAL